MTRNSAPRRARPTESCSDSDLGFWPGRASTHCDVAGSELAVIGRIRSEAWRLPKPVAQNRNAFNDWMRDFDNLTNLYLDKPPAAGYLTEITDAHLILAKQPDVFSGFAGEIPFYRDYYRDDLEPPAALALLLSVPADRRDEVSERWQAVGTQIAP